VLLAALVVAAAAAATTFFLVRPGNPGHGSLVGFEGTMGFGLPLKHVGDRVSVSGPYLVKNNGSQPLVLDRVVPVDAQSGIVLRGDYVLYRPDHLGSWPGYRVPQNGHPLHGATVAPHTRVEIVLGVEVTKRGRHSWQGVRVFYRQGGQTYSHDDHLGVEVCAPPPKNCPTPFD
jgi:hypothetical protein